MTQNTDDFLAGLGTLALGSRLKRCADALMQDGQRIYKLVSEGFEPRWFPILKHLADRGPASITELARGLGVSHPAINRLVDELLAVRLIASYRDRSDKRKRVVALTSDGRARVQALEPVWRQIRQALQGLVDEGGGDFIRSLTQLEQSLARRGFYDRFHEIQASQGERQSAQVEITTWRPELSASFKLLNEAWIKHYFTMEETDRQTLDDPEAHVITPGGEILFALDGAEVLGTCALIKIDDKRVELAKMAVSERAKGLGIGYLLGEATIAAARERGFATLCLESNRKLNPAITLYRKLGFEEVSPPHESSYSRADIYMEMQLG